MEQWTIAHHILPRAVIQHMLEAANIDKPPDHFVLRGQVFGVPVVYERTVKRNEDGHPLVYFYSLYTDSWVIETKHDNRMYRLQEEAIVEWIGRGDHGQWLADASLMKLLLS